jgi:hypothetical protein
MQVKTRHGQLHIGRQEQRPTISLAIQPQVPTGYLLTGVVLGVVLGFVAGSLATLLLGEKSLLIVQGLWNRLTRTTDEDGERVHFELLLQ